MTSNELAQQSESNLELLPPAHAPSSQARAMLHEHARMYRDASELAGALVRTTMVPKRFFGKQGDAAAAILYGAEIGLNPIQSLQRVVAIHGMPSLEARTMVGLLKSRGYKVRTVEQSDKSVTVEGEAPDGERSSSTWTIERAIQAGYVPIPTPNSQRRPDVEDDWVTVTKTWDGKARKSIVGNMKYITDPQTMLKAKAQAEVCRELAPDVLMGISYAREDLESEPQDQFDNREPSRSRPAPVQIDEIFAEEVPIPEPAAATPQAKPDAHQTPAGDEDQDVEHPAPVGDPSPAEQPETVAEPEPAPKKAPAKKAAKKADADKPKTRIRQALEKRVDALFGDAGLTESDDSGRVAVYRSILGNPAVESADDLDDVQLAKVGDELWKWSESNDLENRVASIWSDAALDEAQAAAPATAPTSEGNE